MAGTCTCLRIVYLTLTVTVIRQGNRLRQEIEALQVFLVTCGLDLYELFVVFNFNHKGKAKNHFFALRKCAATAKVLATLPVRFLSLISSASLTKTLPPANMR